MPLRMTRVGPCEQFIAARDLDPCARMAAHVRMVTIPDEDRRELVRRARRRARRPGWSSGRGSCCWPAREFQAANRRAGRLCRAHGGHLAALLRRVRLGRTGRPAPAGLGVPAARSPAGLGDRATLTAPPTSFGATHWSSRLLAAALAAEGTPISHATVARIWHRFGVPPWRAETFKFSTDPQLEAKIRDVVGLYLHPPDKGPRGAAELFDRAGRHRAHLRRAHLRPAEPRGSRFGRCRSAW